MPIEPAEDRGLPRRDFLKVGLGFSLALTVGTAVVGCSDAAKTLSTGYVFLRPGDVELFSALTPAVVTELGAFDAAKRQLQEYSRVMRGDVKTHAARRPDAGSEGAAPE